MKAYFQRGGRLRLVPEGGEEKDFLASLFLQVREGIKHSNAADPIQSSHRMASDGGISLSKRSELRKFGCRR